MKEGRRLLLIVHEGWRRTDKNKCDYEANKYTQYDTVDSCNIADAPGSKLGRVRRPPQRSWERMNLLEATPYRSFEELEALHEDKVQISLYRTKYVKNQLTMPCAVEVKYTSNCIKDRPLSETQTFPSKVCNY